MIEAPFSTDPGCPAQPFPSVTHIQRHLVQDGSRGIEWNEVRRRPLAAVVLDKQRHGAILAHGLGSRQGRRGIGGPVTKVHQAARKLTLDRDTAPQPSPANLRDFRGCSRVGTAPNRQSSSPSLFGSNAYSVLQRLQRASHRPGSHRRRVPGGSESQVSRSSTGSTTISLSKSWLSSGRTLDFSTIQTNDTNRQQSPRGTTFSLYSSRSRRGRRSDTSLARSTSRYQATLKPRPEPARCGGSWPFPQAQQVSDERLRLSAQITHDRPKLGREPDLVLIIQLGNLHPVVIAPDRHLGHSEFLSGGTATHGCLFWWRFVTGFRLADRPQ